MFGISWDQISGLVQRILMFAGGIVVGKGWISEQLLIQIVGAIMSIGGLLWGVNSNTQTSLVSSVNAIPSVRGVITAQTTEGEALAKSVPERTVAVAGSVDAKAVAA